MTETKPKRRWFRFSLRTLLTVVMLAAMSSWAYRFGWPWWRDREYRPLLESVKHLKAGTSEEQALQLIKGVNYPSVFKTEIHASDQSDTPNRPTSMISCTWGDTIVCIYFVADDDNPGAFQGLFNSARPCHHIEVFRLAARPDNYSVTRIPINRGGWFRYTRMLQLIRTQDISLQRYVEDFAAFISSDRKDNPGFQYELIYSDPPAKPQVADPRNARPR